MATVTFAHATRVYPGVERPAVDSLDLEIADGEFLVLVGPSGCGKSTSLRMLAGLEDVTRGTVHIGDRDVSNLPPKDRDIAMVFQNYALYPHMTVAENMGFALKIAKWSAPDIRQRVEEAAQLLDLVPYLDRKPKALSGGQRQRVAMGRAIVREPQVFLMDEPLSNLDAKLRTSTRSQIAALQRRLGVTTVYVTHDQVEAMTMGDRVAVLKDGQLQQCDTPAALYQRPANAFVAGFIGSPAMNIREFPVIDGAVAIGGYRTPLSRAARGGPPARRPPWSGSGRRRWSWSATATATAPGSRSRSGWSRTSGRTPTCTAPSPGSSTPTTSSMSSRGSPAARHPARARQFGCGSSPAATTCSCPRPGSGSGPEHAAPPRFRRPRAQATRRSSPTTTHFEVGVLLSSAVESSGISGLVSG
jgi:multiple sugar transport system ATP-binding protein